MEDTKNENDMTIQQASDYWDEHDFTEFDDVAEVHDLEFNLKRKKYIGIEESLFSQIQKKARKLHKTKDALINDWLREKAMSI